VIAESVSPASGADGDIVSYILVQRPWRRCRPTGAADNHACEIVDRGRTDLVAESLRLIAEKTRAEQQHARH